VLKKTEHRHLIASGISAGNQSRGGGDERYRLFNSARQLAFRNSGQATVDTVPAAAPWVRRRGARFHLFPGRSTAADNDRKCGRPGLSLSAEVRPQADLFASLYVERVAGPVCSYPVPRALSVTKTIHQGDVGAQTRETMANINALVWTRQIAWWGWRLFLDGLKFKVYVRQPSDLRAIEARSRGRCGRRPHRVSAGRRLPRGFAGGDRGQGESRRACYLA